MNQRRSNQFVVTTSLGTEQFDSARAAKAQLKAVMAEVKRIRRSDRRVKSAELRSVFGTRASFLLDLTIVAPTGWEAFEIGSAVVRSSIHTVGGSTAGWEQLRPQLAVGEMRGHALPPSGPMSWADASAAAARRAATLPVLPPFNAPVPARVPVSRRFVSTSYIDLR